MFLIHVSVRNIKSGFICDVKSRISSILGTRDLTLERIILGTFSYFLIVGGLGSAFGLIFIGVPLV